MTYLLISLPFLAASVWVWVRRRSGQSGQWQRLALVLTVLCVLTVIFDNLMVAVGLFDYAPGNNMGIFLGRVPVEDLFYPVFVSLMATALWPKERE